jgi:glycine betaine/proline transport system permease protein
VSPRAKATIAGVVAVVVVVVVYKITRGQNVPSWLDMHLQRNALSAYNWIADNTGRNWFLNLTKAIGDSLTWAVQRMVTLLRWLRWTGVVALVLVTGYLRSGLRTAVIAAACMFCVGLLGFWELTMITLSIMLTAVILSMLVGVPLGIWSGLSDRAERYLRPVLDTAQVMPAYVYLIPLTSLFGISYAPAVIATMIYATPPAVRLTSLGIRQVPEVATEVGRSFGSTSRQLLRKVQLPMANRTVMLGLNQVIMMAFGIVVIAALLGTGDVGSAVLTGLQKQDARLAFGAGLCIVFAAVALDRITTGQAKPLEERLPVGLRSWRRWLPLATAVVVGAALVAKLIDLAVFPSWRVDAGGWASTLVDWANNHLRRGIPVIGGTSAVDNVIVRDVAVPLKHLLQSIAWWLVVLVAALLGWVVRGWRLALMSALCFVGIAAMANWDLAMDTLSQVLIAVVISVVLAVPIGVWAGRSRWLANVLRPVLDIAQVLPQFVYLVPVTFLFSVGVVPGIVASVVYALPPGVRLVTLGLKEAPFAPREAAMSFGATPRQELVKVQLPLAMKAILLGINQVILMVLATVIIAGQFGGGALGLETVSGVTKPLTKIGDGAAAGVSIILLAVFLDRLTQGWGRRFDYDSGHT